MGGVDLVQDMDSILHSIKQEFPDKAIDLSDCLELLKETINDLMNSINEKSGEAFGNRDFASRRKYDDMAIVIHEYEQYLDSLINLIDVDVVDDRSDTDEEEEKTTIPDYSAYLVDSNVEHTLYEDFTHKRPFAFRINDQNVVEVKTWKEMLVSTAELLIAINSEIILGFENIPSMNGKKNKYFGRNKDEMSEPRLVGNKIYVETLMSANSIRNMIVKMLKAYGYKAADYKVYFRADYTELNK